MAVSPNRFNLNLKKTLKGLDTISSTVLSCFGNFSERSADNMQMNKCFTPAVFTAVHRSFDASDVSMPNRSASALLERLF